MFCVSFCGFLRFFTPVWWSHQQTSNKDMPTMFHYTATVTHYPQRSGSCCPMRRGLHHFRDKQCHCVWRRRIKNKIESNKKYIYRKKKPQKHRWEGTDFGWWPHSPGEAGPHARDSHLALDCHGHTHLHGTIPFCTSKHLQRAALD